MRRRSATAAPTNRLLKGAVKEKAARLADRAAAAVLGESEKPLDILIADDRTIRTLNREYRGVDKPTDTLAFPDEEGADPRGGSIAVSIETAYRQAREAGRPLSEEIGRLAVHAALHLAGHDHHSERDAAEMRAAEQAALQTFRNDPRAAELSRELDSEISALIF